MPLTDSRRLPADRPWLHPGSTCWRVEGADRIAFLVDNASYFAAARSAMLRAQRSILLLGWSFDPRTRFDPASDETIGGFLKELAAARPELEIRLLIWDQPGPVSVPRWRMPQRATRLEGDRLHYRLDASHPPGAAHHQKLLVIDDRVAFCGGADFEPIRWDTSAHPDHDPRRRLPSGRPYPPRHNVTMLVEGAAAVALGDLARARWRRATDENLNEGGAPGSVWPDAVPPELTDVPVGISRTLPAWRGQAEVREVEALWLGAIASARRWIYVESQYVASPLIAAALAARLTEADGPDIVVICPRSSPSYFDRYTMDPARDRLVARLKRADRWGRLRVCWPRVRGGTPIVVHSKLLAVDGRLLQIGSANFNNRSLGFDSECGLAVEAVPGDPAAPRTRRAIEALVDRLLAEHLGATPERVHLARQGAGLVSALDVLNPPQGRGLQAIGPRQGGPLRVMVGNHHLFDPVSIRDNWRPWRRPGASRRLWMGLGVLGIMGAAALAYSIAARPPSSRS